MSLFWTQYYTVFTTGAACLEGEPPLWKGRFHSHLTKLQNVKKYGAIQGNVMK